MTRRHRLDFDRPPADPVPVFEAWFEDARASMPTPNPNAMTLATVGPDGRPEARIVLLKGFDARGAVFFTNRTSRKGEALAAHPRAALLFHWDHLDRQVRIEGEVRPTSEAESDEYFASRPRESRINAWASRQSRPIATRAALEAMQAEVEARFAGGEVPRPPHWGGYRVGLGRIEFWEGDKVRLHDRIAYVADGQGGFTVERLCP
jgi:pyridoxamine 5'-phosphate oxidase